MTLTKYPIVASQSDINKSIMNNLGKQNINDCINYVKNNNVICGKPGTSNPSQNTQSNNSLFSNIISSASTITNYFPRPNNNTNNTTTTTDTSISGTSDTNNTSNTKTNSMSDLLNLNSSDNSKYPEIQIFLNNLNKNSEVFNQSFNIDIRKSGGSIYSENSSKTYIVTLNFPLSLYGLGFFESIIDPNKSDLFNIQKPTEYNGFLFLFFIEYSFSNFYKGQIPNERDTIKLNEKISQIIKNKLNIDIFNNQNKKTKTELENIISKIKFTFIVTTENNLNFNAIYLNVENENFLIHYNKRNDLNNKKLFFYFLGTKFDDEYDLSGKYIITKYIGNNSNLKILTLPNQTPQINITKNTNIFKSNNNNNNNKTESNKFVSGCKYIVYDTVDDMCYVPRYNDFKDDVSNLTTNNSEIDNNLDRRYKIILINDGKEELLKEQIKFLESKSKKINENIKNLKISLKQKQSNLTLDEVIEQERNEKEMKALQKTLTDLEQNKLNFMNELRMNENIFDITNELINRTKLTENIQNNNVELNTKLIQNMNNNISSITSQIENNNKLYDINDNFAYYLKIGLILSIIICIVVIIIYAIKGKNQVSNNNNLINKNFNINKPSNTISNNNFKNLEL